MLPAYVSLSIRVSLLFPCMLLKGVAKGVGGWGARDFPFCKPFLTKQPTTGGENVMMLSWPQ